MHSPPAHTTTTRITAANCEVTARVHGKIAARLQGKCAGGAAGGSRLAQQRPVCLGHELAERIVEREAAGGGEAEAEQSRLSIQGARRPEHVLHAARLRSGEITADVGGMRSRCRPGHVVRAAGLQRGQQQSEQQEHLRRALDAHLLHCAPRTRGEPARVKASSAGTALLC